MDDSALQGLLPEQLEAAARKTLPAATYDYFAGGAETESTLQDNLRAFAGWRFSPRVLAATGVPDAAVELLGARLRLPVLLAPTAMQRLAHPEGEAAAARAAAAAGTVYCLSTLASTRMEAVAETVGSAPRWFQLYPCRDLGLTAELVGRAEACGFTALVLTADTPVSGRRERHGPKGFVAPPEVRYQNLASDLAEAPGSRGLDFDTRALFNDTFAWSDLEGLVGSTRLPVLVKGVLRADDAARAVSSGAAGVIVSNHGGRQLDWTVASLDALPGVVDQVGGTVPVLVDGGVRRGTDVLKALALGARAVLIGRPYLWALALGGEAGVVALLARLDQEITVAMTLLGARSCADLAPDLLVRASTPSPG